MSGPALIPQPRRVRVDDGVCLLGSSSGVRVDPECARVERLLGATLSALGGEGMQCAEIVAHLDPARAEPGREGYWLQTTPERVTIAASTETGLLWGVQTLRQLLTPEALTGIPHASGYAAPCVEIEDWARFAWRGVHLDVARHFFPVDTVKRLIDLAAFHKLNRFHWHLTDDQGWRIEIKRFPLLTEVGSRRRETLIGHQRDQPHRFDGQPHGGFYTQDEIRDVVAFAHERGVSVVPEIEMPGHATAAIAAYPELGNLATPLEVATSWGIWPNTFNVEETTFAFLEGVLDEVLDLFPGEYIHIGGDEAPKTQWNESAAARARMAQLRLSNADELQSYVVGRMDAFLQARGRKMVGWDEILEGGLAPHATVMSWRGEAGGIEAARHGHDVVMTPGHSTYLCQYQFDPPDGETLGIGGYLPLERVYRYEPVPAELSADEATHVLGTQAQLWTEYVSTQAQADFKLFPRLCALAEVAWSAHEQRDYADFVGRLEQHNARLDALGVQYARRQSRP